MSVIIRSGSKTDADALRAKLRALRGFPCCACADDPKCPCTNHKHPDGSAAQHSTSPTTEAIHSFENENQAGNWVLLVPSADDAANLTAQEKAALPVKLITDVTRPVATSAAPVGEESIVRSR